MMRLHYEIDHWSAAARAGQFFGLLLNALGITTMIMAAVTDHAALVPAILIGFFGLQFTVAFICLKCWHRS
jgi:hypothetical protein